ncbi:MAG: hypothetical protein JSV60_00685 [Desulfobacterales bacterium]|nr:MAG: hypothetical protein JSV60_00685 [Desulfobacterales bacterium]
MKILAMDRFLPGVTEEKVYPHLKEEAARAWELYTNEVFREIYFRKDRPGAVLILECNDVEEAREVLNSLPLVKANLIEFDIIPLGPFMPFSVLFAEEG